MSWKVRHEGSPQAVEVPSAQQVLEGLNDGLWEPTDEVQGPADAGWAPLETHPTFAEAAAEIEPPPPRHYDDETNLDMTPLIDVCLVLLIFFILTTTYAALQSRLASPEVGPTNEGVLVITDKEVKDQMVKVSVQMEGDKPVYKVEDKVVEPGRLVAELRKFTGSANRNNLLLVVGPKVKHGDVVLVQDAAKEAGMTKVSRLVP